VTIRILVADDQELVRSGFRMILEAREDMEVVGEARTGSEAIDLAGTLLPHVILMDVRMPELDGIEATRRIVGSGSESKIVVLTTYDADEYVFSALRAGATGFLLKDIHPAGLVDAVRVAAAGNALLDPAITRRVIEHFTENASAPAVQDSTRLQTLTERELEVLQLVALARNNAEIAESLFVSEATVKTHVSAILRKLGLRDRVQAVVFAYENGIAG
jgi:DNA-binding NarL/FixJ family response regulator